VSVSLLIAVVLLQASSIVVSGEDDNSGRALIDGIRQVEEGDLEGAVITLDGVVRQLSEERKGEKEVALAHLYLGMAHLGLSQWERAKSEMREAWRNDPAMKLDAKRFPPRVMQLYSEVLSEEQRSRPNPRPTPMPTSVNTKSGGMSKGLVIGLGVGAVAVGAVVVAQSAGGSATAAPTPTASPTPNVYTIAGPGGCTAPFQVDDYLLVIVGSQPSSKLGDVPGDYTGPAVFSAYPGTPGLIQFYDYGGYRELSPLFLCKNGNAVEELTQGVQRSQVIPLQSTPVLVLQMTFTTP
jgi:hypothetical protein